MQFPNSKFAPDAEQLLRNIQEAIAESEFRVGKFYHSRGSYNAAANRLSGVADQFPLFSNADDSLWLEESSPTGKLGPAFRAQEADSLVRIVRDYPLSEWVDQAKARLTELEVKLPEADLAAQALYAVRPGQSGEAGHDEPLLRFHAPRTRHVDRREEWRSADESAEAEHSAIGAGSGRDCGIPG